MASVNLITSPERRRRYQRHQRLSSCLPEFNDRFTFHYQTDRGLSLIKRERDSPNLNLPPPLIVLTFNPATQGEKLNFKEDGGCPALPCPLGGAGPADESLEGIGRWTKGESNECVTKKACRQAIKGQCNTPSHPHIHTIHTCKPTIGHRL